MDRLQLPKHLSPPAAAEWKRIVGILGDTRTLTKADIAALSIYASSYSQYVEAMKSVSEQGAVIEGKKNPYLTVAKEAWERLRVLLIEFGLTPASRQKMKPVVQEVPDDYSDC